MTLPILEQAKRTAINAFASRAAIPLLHFENPGGGGEAANGIGTGTLFRRAGRLFLVTARHLFEDFSPENLAVPMTPTGNQVRTLGDFALIRPDDDFLDVAVLEIQAEETRASLESEWTVLDIEHVIDCPDTGDFYLFGFPWATVRREDLRITGVPLAIFTTRIGRTPSTAVAPVYANVDLFFAHTERVTDIDGTERELPALHGLSGCSIWSVRDVPEGEVWTAERALRVVGIQSSFRSGEYIRAKQWRWAAGILERI